MGRPGMAWSPADSLDLRAVDSRTGDLRISRGRKTDLFQGLLYVPTCFHWEGTVQPCKYPVSFVPSLPAIEKKKQKRIQSF